MNDIARDLLGDARPAGTVARLGTARLRQEGVIGALAFSPDGRYLDGISSRTIHRWEVEGGAPCSRVELPFAANAAAFAPDGRTLATVHFDRREAEDAVDHESTRRWPATTSTITLLEAGTGRELVRSAGHRIHYQRVVASPDGKTFALVPVNLPGTHESVETMVVLFDAVTGAELARLVGHESRVEDVAFLAGGRSVVTASWSAVHVFEAATGKILVRLEGLGDLAVAVVGPEKVLVGGEAGIRLLDLGRATSASVAQHPCRHVVVSPDGTKLAWASGLDSKLHLADASTGHELRTIETAMDHFRTVVFSPDGRRLAAADHHGGVAIYDTTSGAEVGGLARHKGPVRGVAWLPEGRTVASGSEDRTVRLWDAASGRLRQTLDMESAARALEVAASGKRIAAVANGGLRYVWDLLAKGAAGLRSFQRDLRLEACLAFAPDGARLACVARRDPFDDSLGRVRVEAVETPAETLALEGGVDRVDALAWSRDGRSIAGALEFGPGLGVEEGRELWVWDAASGRRRARIRDLPERVEAIGLAPDGSRVLSVGTLGAVRAHEGSKEILALRVLGAGETFTAAAFSPDGRHLAGSLPSGAVVVWDAVMGNVRRRFEGRQGAVWCLAWSPDGRRLAAGGQDSTVLVWDVAL